MTVPLKELESSDAFTDKRTPELTQRRSQDEEFGDDEALVRSNSASSVGPTRRFSLGEERAKWWKIYALHFLFMWNIRTYEFASVSNLLSLNRIC